MADLLPIWAHAVCYCEWCIIRGGAAGSRCAPGFSSQTLAIHSLHQQTSRYSGQTKGQPAPFFADDTQLYAIFKVKDRAGTKSTLAKLESCISDVKAWMVHICLQLNDAKTEFLIVVSPQQEAHLNLSPIRVGGAEIQPAVQVQNLGTIFDKYLSMKAHVNHLCKTAYFHLRNIGIVRNCLTEDSAKSLMHALVTARIDAGNSLLYGLPKTMLYQVQKVLNTAARIVTLTPKRESISS